MALENGAAGSKRKRGEGSGSGDGQEYPGDPPTADHAEVTEVDHAENSTTLSGSGVRVRVLSEIKNWARSGSGDCKGRDFLVDVKVPDEGDVETRTLVALVVHDCARLYRDPGHPVKNPNILTVERWLRKPQVLKDEDCIGKSFLDEYVRSHPVSRAPLEWKGLDKDNFKALKLEIVNRAHDCFNKLKTKIAEVERSRAGRQRQDEAEILPRVVENEPANLEDEIKRPEDQIACMKVAHAEQLRAKDDQIAAFVMKEEYDDEIIAVLLKIIENGNVNLDPASLVLCEESLSNDDSLGYEPKSN